MTDQAIEQPVQVPGDTAEFQPMTEQRGGACGCWITGITTLAVFSVLVVIGLLLPPINLLDRLTGPQYAALSPDANAVREGAFTFAVYGDVTNDFAVALDTTTPDALNAPIPPALALDGAVYAITTEGTAPDAVTLSIDVPAERANAPLDLYTLRNGTWTFTPSQRGSGVVSAEVDDLPQAVALMQPATVDQPVVLAAYDVTQVLDPNAAQVANIVAPAGLQPTVTGALAGSLAAGFSTEAGYRVMPAIRNYVDPHAVDADTVTALLMNGELRRTHTAQVAAFAASGDYAGVVIDYRDLPADVRPAFTAFITELAAALDSIGKTLIVSVPAAVNTGAFWDSGAYDYRALGAAADYVQIQLPLDPEAFVPGAANGVEALITYAAGEISRSKLLIGLSAHSLRETNDTFTPVAFEQAVSALGDVEIDTEWSEGSTIPQGQAVQARLNGFTPVVGIEPASMQPYIDYMNDAGSAVGRFWLTTAEALRYRMDRAFAYALGGVAFDDLMQPGGATGILETIQSYKLGIPALAANTPVGLRWTIQSAAGVVDQVTTGLGDPLVATIQAPDGNYAINVEVIAGENVAQREGAAVAVFAPTNTPTPTPTPTATPTPTPRPVQVAAAPPAASSGGGGGGAAVAPGAGSIAGGSFEYGGHVVNPATGAAGLMRSAGMNWMKVQLRYSPGADPGIAAGYISAAHGAGFKILLGIVGYPNDLAGGGDGYVQGFASFLGGVAAQGPDAIEVWNEANIDREWPQGQISGATYASMMRLAYQAIKGANGGVMVISAAPAPTGAEAAFPGRVVNDDNWLRQFVEAGGLGYVDCVGAHYNEGVVAPSAMSGDPRDNYYTRYFLGMVNTYWGIIGGQKPLCFTELGYLTPEGYPPLDPYFAWGANTSVAEQAAWLAEAAALASQSGKVRLMIIWNIDFQNYGADPMAGFAIIRPGGGCPACSALAGAR